MDAKRFNAPPGGCSLSLNLSSGQGPRSRRGGRHEHHFQKQDGGTLLTDSIDLYFFQFRA